MECIVQKKPHYEILSLKTWWEPIIVMFPPSNGYTINGINPLMSNHRSFFPYPMLYRYYTLNIPVCCTVFTNTGMVSEKSPWQYGVPYRYVNACMCTIIFHICLLTDINLVVIFNNIRTNIDIHILQYYDIKCR